MKISSAYFSHRGKKSENEDAVLPLVECGETWWAAIADGMGGHAGGQIASTTAIVVLQTMIKKNSHASFPEIFASIRNELRKISDQRPELTKMGTTLSLLALEENRARIGHVGDSRIYHLRNEGIVSRTVDQTEVQELVARGVLSKAAARRYPRRNVLLSVLSPHTEYQLSKSIFDVLSRDRLVLITDGVSSKVLTRELRDLSLESSTPQMFCEKLMEMVALREPADDYTAICLDIQ